MYMDEKDEPLKEVSSHLYVDTTNNSIQVLGQNWEIEVEMKDEVDTLARDS